MKRPVNPADLADPIGFAHGWLVEHGEARTLYLAGQCGYDRSGAIVERGDLTGQLARAIDRKSTRLNSSHCTVSRMPSSA